MSVINERSKRCKSDDTTTIEVEDVSAWVLDGYHVTYPNTPPQQAPGNRNKMKTVE